jgi:hypothetical protein
MCENACVLLLVKRVGVDYGSHRVLIQSKVVLAKPLLDIASHFVRSPAFQWGGVAE